jgi:hypothetical protein
LDAEYKELLLSELLCAATKRPPSYTKATDSIQKNKIAICCRDSFSKIENQPTNFFGRSTKKVGCR